MKFRGRALNPVLARELKERMRGKRAVVILTAYLAILAIAAQLIYRSASRDRSTFIVGPDPLAAASVGRSMFETLLTFMVVLVLFIVPGMTAGSVAGERERRTLAPLQVTLMSPRSILAGKLMASLAFNPRLATADIVRGKAGALQVVDTPLTSMQKLVAVDGQGRNAARFGVRTAGPPVATTAPGRINIVGQPRAPFLRLPAKSKWHAIPFWSKTVIVYAGLAVLAFLLSVRRLRTPSAAGMFT